MIRHNLLFAGTLTACFFVLSARTSTIHAAEPKQEPAKAQEQHYQVQSGDYLEAIADTYHISWPSIFEKNATIQNPDMIYPDQKLAIPTQDLPLTRSLPQTTMEIPATYIPQPLAPTKNKASINQSVQAQTVTLASSSARSANVGNAYNLVGTRYIYGGTTTAGFDCSGLTQYLAAQRGMTLPRTVMEQYSATRRIGLADAQAGDLIFFNANHVGMYLGNNQVIHATNPSQGVRIDTLTDAIKYNGYMAAGALGR